MYTESQKNASKKWNSTNTVLITMRLVKTTDKDILDHLDSVGNKQGYLKALVRLDIEKSKGEKRE